MRRYDYGFLFLAAANRLVVRVRDCDAIPDVRSTRECADRRVTRAFTLSNALMKCLHFDAQSGRFAHTVSGGKLVRRVPILDSHYQKPHDLPLCNCRNLHSSLLHCGVCFC
jgi:hypothetical protein